MLQNYFMMTKKQKWQSYITDILKFHKLLINPWIFSVKNVICYNHHKKIKACTWKSNVMESMEMTFFLAKFCRVPVKKAWGKKKPDIQKTWEHIAIFGYIYFKQQLLDLVIHILNKSCWPWLNTFKTRLTGPTKKKQPESY